MSFKLPSLQNLLPGNVHKRLPQLQQGRSNSRCDTESSISQNSLDQAIWGHLYGAERLMLSTLATLGASMVWVGCSMFKAAVPGLTRKQTPNNTAMTNLLSDAVKIRQTWTDTTASAAGTCANKNLKSTVAKAVAALMLAIAFTTAIRRLVSQAGDSAARNAFQLSEGDGRKHNKSPRRTTRHNDVCRTLGGDQDASYL